MNALRFQLLPLAVVVLMAVTLPSCRKTSTRVTAPPQEPAAESRPPAPPDTAAAPVPAPPVVSASREVVADDAVFDEPGWVHVEALRPDVEGAWVTGDFHEARNKIEIQTRGVKQFSLDLGRLRIDWDRLVVIGIDGRNAELRHRDTDLLHIARDDTGAWVVLEP